MKKICTKCKEGKHEQCVTRDTKAREYRCSCGCVGNPFVGIVCVNIPKYVLSDTPAPAHGADEE